MLAQHAIKGNCTPDPKLTCFALLSKVLPPFLQNNVYILSKMSKELKNCIGIFVDQAYFKLWSITQGRLAYFNFSAIFFSSLDN